MLADARSSAQLVIGATLLAVAVSVGVGVDPGAAGLATAAGPSASSAPAVVTGHTTRVRVQAQDMRFTPDTITVPQGDRLLIDLVNADPSTVHDLAVPTGEKTPRLRPGESATLDAGIVEESFTAWCTVVGHRQMGMRLTVAVTGTPRLRHRHPQPMAPASRHRPPVTPTARRLKPLRRSTRPSRRTTRSFPRWVPTRSTG